MVNLCIIPARGGSKRIPRKNIKNFLGKPIILYSIEAALESNLFDEVMVSTDDQEIAELAVASGAKVPFIRSQGASTDFATTYDVILEVLQDYENRGVFFKNACCLYPCAPLIRVEKLIEAYHKLKRFETVFPVVKYNYPIQRALIMNENEEISFIHPEFEFSRSQDLTGSFHDAGQFYWIVVSAMFKNKTIMSKNTGAVVLSEMDTQDIDTLLDWKLAEFKFKLHREI